MDVSEYAKEVKIQTCSHAFKFRLAFAMLLVLFPLLLVSLTVVEPGSANYAIVVVDVVTVAVFLLATGYIVWACNRPDA